jgi:uncharacterized membrane protein YesL
MARKGLKGFIDRIVEGSEKSEGFARSTLPSNRWELFWDVFKGKFFKLIGVNLLMLLTFIPCVLVFVFRYFSIIGYGLSYPFSQGFGVGYQAPVDVVGYGESIIFSSNVSSFILMPVAIIFAAIGIAGGAYVIRNMAWNEGDFVAQDFWRGIKINFKQICVIGLLFSIVFYVTFCSTALFDQLITVNSMPKWLGVLVKILCYTIFGIYSVMTIYMITMAVTYEYKLLALLKNSILFTIGLLPINVLIVIASILPYFLFSLGGIMVIIMVIVCLIMGATYFMLVWTVYCQWAFDNNINAKSGYKRNKGIYEKVKKTANDDELKKYRKQKEIIEYGTYNSRPVKPITDDELQLRELPQSFSREDIYKLNESREALYEDNRKYVREHESQIDTNTKGKKTQAQLDEEREKRIERARRELAKRKRK